ncbi:MULTISPECIES: excisionase [Pseudoalteromonas]|jgi:hypothetical protein|uniref:excisionase n=1 Tax=Pseudoalteromonas TaxID=53246 RepID=UPI0013FDED53|nr:MULTISPECIES: excisionase [unclassified Pseudoalteromonas]MBH0050679.1 hypothetical protein [Pseudoalteromonas sp. SWYJZ19]
MAISIEWVTLNAMAKVTGYTVAALRSKIKRGQLFEEKHWRRAQDGRLLIHVGNFNEWLKQ